jgi:hypothetical protein
VDDSGARLFLDGEYYYRHIGPLCLSLSVAKTITDVGWREYLEGTRAISRKFGHLPKVGVAAFTGVHPNAGQRRMTTEFLAEENVRPLERLALLTDNELLRGAMVAFGWAMPKSRLRAFKGSDHLGAFRWLREVAEFDEKQAAEIWRDAHAKLGVGRPDPRLA